MLYLCVIAFLITSGLFTAECVQDFVGALNKFNQEFDPEAFFWSIAWEGAKIIPESIINTLIQVDRKGLRQVIFDKYSRVYIHDCFDTIFNDPALKKDPEKLVFMLLRLYLNLLKLFKDMQSKGNVKSTQAIGIVANIFNFPAKWCTFEAKKLNFGVRFARVVHPFVVKKAQELGIVYDKKSKRYKSVTVVKFEKYKAFIDGFCNGTLTVDSICEAILPDLNKKYKMVDIITEYYKPIWKDRDKKEREKQATKTGEMQPTKLSREEKKEEKKATKKEEKSIRKLPERTAKEAAKILVSFCQHKIMDADLTFDKYWKDVPRKKGVDYDTIYDHITTVYKETIDTVNAADEFTDADLSEVNIDNELLNDAYADFYRKYFEYAEATRAMELYNKGDYQEAEKVFCGAQARSNNAYPESVADIGKVNNEKLAESVENKPEKKKNRHLVKRKVEADTAKQSATEPTKGTTQKQISSVEKVNIWKHVYAYETVAKKDFSISLINLSTIIARSTLNTMISPSKKFRDFQIISIDDKKVTYESAEKNDVIKSGYNEKLKNLKRDITEGLRMFKKIENDETDLGISQDDYLNEYCKQCFCDGWDVVKEAATCILEHIEYLKKHGIPTAGQWLGTVIEKEKTVQVYSVSAADTLKKSLREREIKNESQEDATEEEEEANNGKKTTVQYEKDTAKLVQTESKTVTQWIYSDVKRYINNNKSPFFDGTGKIRFVSLESFLYLESDSNNQDIQSNIKEQEAVYKNSDISDSEKNGLLENLMDTLYEEYNKQEEIQTALQWIQEQKISRAESFTDKLIKTDTAKTEIPYFVELTQLVGHDRNRNLYIHFETDADLKTFNGYVSQLVERMEKAHQMELERQQAENGTRKKGRKPKTDYELAQKFLELRLQGCSYSTCANILNCKKGKINDLQKLLGKMFVSTFNIHPATVARIVKNALKDAQESKYKFAITAYEIDTHKLIRKFDSANSVNDKYMDKDGTIYSKKPEGNNLIKLNKSGILKCCDGLRPSSGGYYWEYTEPKELQLARQKKADADKLEKELKEQEEKKKQEETKSSVDEKIPEKLQNSAVLAENNGFQAENVEVPEDPRPDATIGNSVTNGIGFKFKDTVTATVSEGDIVTSYVMADNRVVLFSDGWKDFPITKCKLDFSQRRKFYIQLKRVYLECYEEFCDLIKQRGFSGVYELVTEEKAFRDDAKLLGIKLPKRIERLIEWRKSIFPYSRNLKCIVKFNNKTSALMDEFKVDRYFVFHMCRIFEVEYRDVLKRMYQEAINWKQIKEAQIKFEKANLTYNEQWSQFENSQIMKCFRAPTKEFEVNISRIENLITVYGEAVLYWVATIGEEALVLFENGYLSINDKGEIEISDEGVAFIGKHISSNNSVQSDGKQEA